MQKKVGIIYDGTKGTDWAIDSFKKGFEKKDIPVVLFDANQVNSSYSGESWENMNLPEIESFANKGYTVWMNRVYPSDSTKEVIDKSLGIVSWLGSRNHITINPLTACAADYDKVFAYQLMQKYDVPTPRTELISFEERGIKHFLEGFNLPVIVKKNTGGKGLNVMKIEDKENLAKLLWEEDIHSGNYLIQEFAKSNRGYDIRIGIIDGEPLIHYGRTLVSSGESSDLWMGSCHHGSKIIDYTPSEEELRLAVLSSKAIGATLNEVDLKITENGPIIIENNPTPGYDEGEERWVELITDHIYRNHLQNGK